MIVGGVSALHRASIQLRVEFGFFFMISLLKVMLKYSYYN